MKFNKDKIEYTLGIIVVVLIAITVIATITAIIYL